MSTLDTQGENAIAFNDGSEARLRGEPATANPHGQRTAKRHYWDSGWRDVERNFGLDARWPVRHLVRVDDDGMASGAAAREDGGVTEG